MIFATIDIGIKNFAFAIGDSEKKILIDFDLEKIPTSNISSKIIYLIKILTRLKEDYKIERIYIEKQFNGNTTMMCIMYILYTAGLFLELDPQLFDPKLKFVSHGIKYTIKNKQHKKISVELARMYLEDYFVLRDKFESNKKLDDLSDCIVMVFTIFKSLD